jgi:uncharacterized membrane protein (DUF2068 family)
MENVKKRHAVLTVFLIIMIAMNLIIALLYILGRNNEAFQQVASSWVVTTLGLMALFNVVFAIGLWKLKKWGFWGFVITTTVIFLLNFLIVGVPFLKAASGLFLIPLLYVLLLIGGKEKQGWRQLD